MVSSPISLPVSIVAAISGEEWSKWRAVSVILYLIQVKNLQGWSWTLTTMRDKIFYTLSAENKFSLMERNSAFKTCNLIFSHKQRQRFVLMIHGDVLKKTLLQTELCVCVCMCWRERDTTSSKFQQTLWYADTTACRPAVTQASHTPTLSPVKVKLALSSGGKPLCLPPGLRALQYQEESLTHTIHTPTLYKHTQCWGIHS